MDDLWRPRCASPRDLTRPVPADPSGLGGPTRGQAAGPRWRRTSTGLYVPSSVDPGRPEQRILEASMRLPPGGAVTGWASLRMQRAAFFDGRGQDLRELPVPLAIGPGRHIRAAPGTVVLRERLGPGSIIVVRGVPCTIAARALFDAMRHADDDRGAVVAMDMAAAAELLSIKRMLAFVADHQRWPGVARVRRALDLASERSMSPAESGMRLVWVLDAGLPAPLVNWPVFDQRGQHVATPDVLDVEAGVVGEYDGALHRRRARHGRDAFRQEALRRVGLEYFTIVGGDLDNVRLVVERMHSARDRAQRSVEPHGWTIDTPAGWPREQTLDELLDERQRMADFHAGWMAG